MNARHGLKSRSAPPPPTVLVLGGGLAGIAASVRLAKSGIRVHLIETRKRLGGRATSFPDPTTGQTLDNCQHVLMGCCTNLLDLYRHLGVTDHITWHKRLHFAAIHHKGHRRPILDTLEADDLPAPMHMTGALMAFKSLKLNEKFAIARAMLAMMRLGRDRRAKLHNRSFLQWLLDHHQPQGAISKFWQVIIVSALNEQLDHTAADYAIQVFQDGFLANEDAYLMGLPNTPLVDLYDHAAQVICDGGGEVSFGVAAERLLLEDNRITGVRTTDGQTLHADHYLSALPFDRLAKICDVNLLKADPRLRRLDRFTVSPILGIHLWFKSDGSRAVMDLPHLVLIDSPLQWIFNKGIRHDEGSGMTRERTEAPFTQAGGTVQHLHGVISAAQDWINEPAGEIIDLATREVRLALPAARDAVLACARVIDRKSVV